MSTLTKAQIHAALSVLRALADIIRELKQVPNGHLYARVMEHLTLQEYTAFIEKLKSSKLIKEENHVLIWIGD